MRTERHWHVDILWLGKDEHLIDHIITTARLGRERQAWERHRPRQVTMAYCHTVPIYNAHERPHVGCYGTVDNMLRHRPKF